MKYRNIKTGTVIDVNADLGGNWKPVTPPEKAKPKRQTVKKGTEKK